jgi:predicted nucleotidyltransferase
MNLFMDRHQELLKELLDAKVDFIVIGGYSVIFHGYMRTTGDVDIWIKPGNENKMKVLSVLHNLDIDGDTLDTISELDFSKHLAFNFWNIPERVDFLTHVNLVTYDEADNAKIIADIDGLKIPFLHLNHLVLSKMTTGRPKDAADIDELQKIAAAAKKRKS